MVKKKAKATPHWVLTLQDPMKREDLVGLWIHIVFIIFGLGVILGMVLVS